MPGRPKHARLEKPPSIAKLTPPPVVQSHPSEVSKVFLAPAPPPAGDTWPAAYFSCEKMHDSPFTFVE